MRKPLQILAMMLMAGISGAEAQGPAVPQGAAGQNSQNQTAVGGTSPNSGQKPPAQQSRENSGPPYDNCYMKCINAGNQGDFCRANSKNYCY